MLAYMSRRLLLAVFTVWAISVMSFFILERRMRESRQSVLLLAWVHP